MRAMLLLSFLPVMLSANDAFAWRQTYSCIYEEPPAPTSAPYCGEHDIPVGFYWPAMPVHYSIHEASAARVGVPDDELLQAIHASFDAWNAPDCSAFEFAYAGLTDVEYAIDDVNVVLFHDEAWPFASAALAITSVTAKLDGTLINADMELNAEAHEFGIVTDGELVWDIQNTVTHEAGHMLGLDHDAVEDSTMQAEAALGETSKRTLHSDDLEGLCTIYPVAPIPPAADDDGCCSTVTSAADHSAATWVVALLLAVAALRRRKASTSAR